MFVHAFSKGRHLLICINYFNPMLLSINIYEIFLFLATAVISYGILEMGLPWFSQRLGNYFLEKHAKTKLVKNNVCLLFPELKKININLLNYENDIFFFNGMDFEQSYEERTPILNTEEILCITNKIEKRLDKAIELISDDNIIMNIELREQIIELKNKYKYEKINEAIRYVNKERLNENKTGFIGDKYGVYGYQLVNGTLTLSVYRTDHFAWHVFKYIYEQNKSFFIKLIKYLPNNNQDNHIEISEDQKNALLIALSFLFSSIGADIMVWGRNGKYEKCFVQGLRSRNVEKDGTPKLHVPVNETLTSTDFIDKQGANIPASDWIIRGIEEELGVPSSFIKDEKMNVSYHDFSIIFDKGEIGFSCDMEMRNLNLDKLKFLSPVDRYLESDGVFIIPYRSSGFIHLFIHVFYCHVLIPMKISLSKIVDWSFTLPIYHRFFIRQWTKSYGYGRYAFIILLLVLFYSYISSDIIINSSIWLSAFIALIKYEKKYIEIKKEFRSKNKEEELIPIIATNVAEYDPRLKIKIIQTTGNEQYNQSTNEKTYKGLYFKISNINREQIIKLDNLVLTNYPICNIRKKKNRIEELPVSYYSLKPFKKNNKSFKKNKLYFIYYYIDNKDNLHYKLNSDNQISFHNNIDNLPIKVCLPKDIQGFNLNENSFRVYFKKSVNDFNNNYFAKLNDDFPYDLYDLFEYNDNFYWTCISTSTSKVFTDKVAICDVNAFVNKNISSISPLDVLSLQFLLSRRNKYISKAPTKSTCLFKKYIFNKFKHKASDINSSSIIGNNTTIGKGSIINKNVEIGNYCIIGKNVLIDEYSKIGSNVVIEGNTVLPKGIVIEDGVFIGEKVLFSEAIPTKAAVVDDNGDLRLKRHGYWDVKTTTIKKEASIGVGSIISCGVIIGSKSVVYPGSVVLNDIYDKTVFTPHPPNRKRS